jgi:type IV secretory pathway VirB10-like protein
VEVKKDSPLDWIRNRLSEAGKGFVKKSEVSEKRELNIERIKWTALFGFVLFLVVLLLLPSEQQTEFVQKAMPEGSVSQESEPKSAAVDSNIAGSAERLWGSSQSRRGTGTTATEVNYNTSMILGSQANSKTRLQAGVRLPLRIMDKFIVSDEPVPVMAELLLDSETESGLRLPAGTKFYGQATFQKGTDRAKINFQQASLPSGEMRQVSSSAHGKDGHPGIPGRVFSDGMKNTAGQVLTTFIGGLAAGSVQTDVFGRSTGGISNGLMVAVSETAKTRAQSYGEKLKAEREWIEVQSGTECDGVLGQAINLQNGGDAE